MDFSSYKSRSDRDVLATLLRAAGVSALVIASACADRATGTASATAGLTTKLRHAELAWRFLAWALERGGSELHEACAAAFAASAAAIAAAALPSATTIKESRLAAHGHLDLGQRHRIAARAAAVVILPAARALLGSHAAPLAA